VIVASGAGIDLLCVAKLRSSLQVRWFARSGSGGHRLAAVLLVVGFLLSLLAFGGMTSLHRYADRRMNATRLVSVVTADLDRLQLMPGNALPDQLGPARTSLEMQVAEAKLAQDLRLLSAYASADALTRGITTDVARNEQVLGQARRLIARNKIGELNMTGALLAAKARGDVINRKAHADLTRASAKYTAAASRARLLATAGSAILLFGLFFAFAGTLLRLRRSQQKQAHTEEQLRQAHKMEAVGQLAGGIAHDFNNLLTAIIGYAGLLSARAADDDVALRYVGEIERASGHAAHLTGELLAFSRKQTLQPRTISLNTVVAETRLILERLIAADIEVDIELDADLPFVHADPTQITGVLLNLCTNAQDAMPNGGRLKVRTHGVDVDAETGALHGVPAGRYAALSVTDSGAGIDDSIRDHIFEPFFTTKPAGTASGLGLATAYGLAQQSSGFIVAEIPEDNGARLSLYLPGVAEPLDDPVSARVSRDRSSLAATVLIVEDQTAVRNLAAEILSGAGCRVITAGSGAEALGQFEDHPEIELLLSDCVMPGMSGPELAERLKVRNPDLPVIFMSGYSGESLLGRGVSPSADLIKKPFTAPQLLQAVEQSMEATRNLAA
jgi:signal transduction histidine kinase